MSYFVKKSYPSKKGLYIQIYQSFYVPKVGKRNKSFKSIGYYDELVSKGISDPIKYAQSIVDELNKESLIRKDLKIDDKSKVNNIGFFLVKAMIDYLSVDDWINMISINYHSRFRMSNFIRSMIYSQIISPGSKYKAFEKVMPNIYGCETFSYDQILDAINFVGNNYQKFIEIFNHKISDKWERKTSKSFFDCTNYYFEIDLPKDDKQQGPSKEERHLPIIGQALLLDEDQIPLAMSLYPGNESEKPKLRETIEDLKTRFDINSKIVQVADKGLNCARNIYAASIEANDGYIFSKSVHGKNLSKQEKEWVLLDNANNIWHEVKDSSGKIIYKYKECIDVFDYSFVDENGKKLSFKIKEKRVVSYNPSLAKKQQAQIQKQIDKVRALSTIRQVSKSEYGDSIKYVNFLSSNNDGEIVDVVTTLNQAKIDEDMMYAGYNLLVTSEINKPAEEIYKTYHGLWRIEESFRIMKTYLEARPVYLQKKESIYGHFTICYLALTLLRLLELKVFNDELPIARIVDFIRSFTITDNLEGSYINGLCRTETLNIIQDRFSLTKLDSAKLKEKDIENFLNVELFD